MNPNHETGDSEEDHLIVKAGRMVAFFEAKPGSLWKLHDLKHYLDLIFLAKLLFKGKISVYIETPQTSSGHLLAMSGGT